MSKATLKKTFKAMDKEDITDMVVELYEKRKDAREFLEFWINPNPDKLLDDYTQRVERVFMTSTGTRRRSPSFPEVNRLIKSFTELLNETDYIVRLYICAAKCTAEWIKARKDTRKGSIEKLIKYYETAKSLIDDSDPLQPHNKIMTEIATVIEHTQNVIDNKPKGVYKTRRKRYLWF